MQKDNRNNSILFFSKSIYSVRGRQRVRRERRLASQRPPLSPEERHLQEQYHFVSNYESLLIGIAIITNCFYYFQSKVHIQIFYRNQTI